jgi:hypothetical protein
VAASCTWDANLSNVAPFPGYESIALELQWDPVSNCGSFTFDHSKVCWNRDTATAPDDPTDADRCMNLGGPIGLDSADFFVHWSATQHGLRIYACDQPEGVDACADHYGEGSGEEVVDDTGTATTEEEVWVLEDIHNYADASRVVADSGASAAGAFYDSTGTHDDKLGLWWSTNAGGRETIRYYRPNHTGWHNFHTLSSWVYGMSSGLDVAEEPDTGNGGKFRNCTHPWVVPTYVYTATWTPGTPGSWSVAYGTSPNCPTITTTGRHDPAVIALPGGEYKVYVHRGLEEFEVLYFDGATWSAPRDIVLAFDDGAGGYTVPSGGTTSLHKCLENLDTFVWHDGQTGYEGAFAKANLDNLNDASDCFDSSGILFLEHRN